MTTSLDVRGELERILEGDLLGPLDGEEEELPGEGPRARYLVGMLAPVGVHTSAEEVDSGLGDLAGEDGDGVDRAAPAAATTMFPRSFGMSFSVPASTNRVVVGVSWGRYTRVHSATLTNSKGEPSLVWKRHPVAHDCPLDLKEGSQTTPNAPWEGAHPDVVLRSVCRRRGDRMVVELSLVNDQQEPETNRDAAWLFQVQLRVRSTEEGAALFLPSAEQRRTRDAAEEDRHLELLYRDSHEYSVGRNVAVHADARPGEALAYRLSTQWLPAAEVPQTVAPTITAEPRLSGLELDMSTLARLEPEQLRTVLRPLADGYESWLDDQQRRLDTEADLSPHGAAGGSAIGDGRHAAGRIRAGIELICTDATALEGFRFANEAMALQRVHSEIGILRRAEGDMTYAAALERSDVPSKRSWRPFQLAFVLLNLPALHDPTHDERSPLYSAIVDLLFFPTGGGKTEAYLGLAAFTFAIRRLQGVVAEGSEARDGMEGVAVLMRYTLRLLTAQQFQRAATLLCACEQLRRERIAGGDQRWGSTPFRIGLWVGSTASPNNYDDAAQEIRRARAAGQGKAGRVLQLMTCPWCAESLRDDRDVDPQDDERRIYIYCGDPEGACPFSRRQAPDEGLPVVVTDEEVYRLMPALVIGTVDKLAQLPWRGQAGLVFGRSNRRCSRHGFRHPDLDSKIECRDRHKQTARLDPAVTDTVIQPRPPDLIIQDELHLISGALGTMVGLYETMVDDLCSWTWGRNRIRPKVISSTATIRRAKEQVRQVFNRGLAVFPPPILDAGDTFFSIQIPVSEAAPGRRYRGICAHGIRLKQGEIRLASLLLTATQYLFDQHGESADPYYTCVAYFNALRELAGMKRLLDDDIAIRARRGHLHGLASRRVPLEVEELTSRMPSGRIGQTLRQLEQAAVPALDSTAARLQKPQPNREGDYPIAVLLATSMLQVGVDVTRLGLMVMTGQPKNTAEYIQATSRVGRDASRPGLVVTLYNWARPRDLAHFETFEHYHDTFYRRVEPLSVTPFAPRAVDRGLTGILVGMIRNAALPYSANRAAQSIDLSDQQVKSVGEVIAGRAAKITADADSEQRLRDAVQDRIDKWLGVRAQLEAALLGFDKATDTTALLQQPGLGDWGTWTVSYSLRETEAEANLVLPFASVADQTAAQAPGWIYEGTAKDDPDLEPDTPDEPEGAQ